MPKLTGFAQPKAPMKTTSSATHYPHQQEKLEVLRVGQKPKLGTFSPQASYKTPKPLRASTTSAPGNPAPLAHVMARLAEASGDE